MTTTIAAIFEKGVFRPLTPISIPENQRVNIRFEDEALAGEGNSPPPRLSPSVFPEDDSDVPELNLDYQSVPAKVVGTVPARVIFAGPRRPSVYPED